MPPVQNGAAPDFFGEKIEQQEAEKMEECAVLPEQIEADTVFVEVTDRNTGKTFRRKLPLLYLENGNGIILSGETLEGKPSELHFLSAQALSRLHELFGKGSERPKCKEPGEERRDEYERLVL